MNPFIDFYPKPFRQQRPIRRRRSNKRFLWAAVIWVSVAVGIVALRAL